MDSNNNRIRRPTAAGMFYPGSVKELTRTIANLFSEVEKLTVDGPPLALIAPHAGYPYSGKTAAMAYKLLEGHQYDTVVVVSPSHTVFFKGSAVFDGDGYQTPLGVIEIDKELSGKIANINPAVYLSGMGHASGSTRGEHALEVHLPFLQIVLGSFKLVAIVMGDQEEESVRSLGETLGSALEGTNTLIVASSDLSHFHQEKEARRLDFNVQQAVEKFDSDLLLKTVASGEGEACGGGVMAAVMLATKRLGAEKIKFIDYTTSGETTGDFSEVVGYLSAAITAGKNKKRVKTILGQPKAEKNDKPDLTDDDKRLLHQIARDSIKARFGGAKYQPTETENLSIKRGLFVTITLDGNLRGCIGRIIGDLPLYEGVAEMAVAAAFEDPRFPPLTDEEFNRLETEISVLTPLERVHDFNKIEVGKHGLLIKLEMNSGLLLPQVATEYGWDRVKFLEQTCLKAGLPKNSYKEKKAEIYSFTAEVF